MEKELKEWSSSWLHNKCVELLSQLGDMKHIKDKKILVIGSWAWNFEHLLISQLQVSPKSITSCDIDPSHFWVSEIQCQQVDADVRLPFQDTTYDIIIMLEVIEHLKNQWGIMEELKRIKTPDWIVMISSPNVEWIFNRVYFLCTWKMSFFSEQDYLVSGHINPLFSWNFKRMLKKNNLQILHYDSNLFYMWIIPFVWKIQVPLKHILFAQLNIFILK